MTKVGGVTVLDPHVTGQCVLELDETAATAMRDQLTEWLGVERLVPAVDG